MTGRTPYELVTRYLDPVQRSLSCITRAVIDRSRSYHLASHPRTASLGDGFPVPLRGASELSFRVSLTYRVVQMVGRPISYRMSLEGYMYVLHDVNSREMLSFHWHPHGASPITYPHLHLGAGAQVMRRELQGSHLPTGMIALEQVIRLAIEELGVEPLRDDWDRILREATTTIGDETRR